jgi:hypothetical protein
VVLCFARVYISGHYPQDVIGGFALRALVVLIGWVIVRIPLTTLIRQLTATPLRPLLMARSRPVLAGGAEGGRTDTTLTGGPAGLTACSAVQRVTAVGGAAERAFLIVSSGGSSHCS